MRVLLLAAVAYYALLSVGIQLFFNKGPARGPERVQARDAPPLPRPRVQPALPR